MTPDPNLIVVDFCNPLCEIRTRLALKIVKAFNWSAGRNLVPPCLMRIVAPSMMGCALAIRRTFWRLKCDHAQAATNPRPRAA